MAEKSLNARIINKHDTAANWALAVNFIPKLGEIIVYDADENNPEPRIKIGDNQTNVVALPFLSESITNDEINSICGTVIYQANEVAL